MLLLQLVRSDHPRSWAIPKSHHKLLRSSQLRHKAVNFQKKMKANAPIKRRAPAARRSSALMAGITVKVISYGQMLMTGSRTPDGRGVNKCSPVQTLPDNGFSVWRAVINDCHTRPVLSVCLFLASHRKRLQSTFLSHPPPPSHSVRFNTYGFYPINLFFSVSILINLLLPDNSP